MASEPLRLSPAELAVVFQHLIGRDVSSQNTLLADSGMSEDQLGEARRALIERGLLMGDSRRSDTALSPSLEPILQTVTAPKALGILQISKPGEAPMVVYISWTESTIAANWIDRDGQHVIEPLPSLAAVGEAIVRWTAIGAFNKAKASETPDAEAIVEKANQRAVFMAVGGVLEDEQHAQAVSWITSEDRLWLMDGQGNGQQPSVHLASAADVRKEVESLLENATAKASSDRQRTPDVTS
jgi:hypothetical protein